jgi:hypothetical protein
LNVIQALEQDYYHSAAANTRLYYQLAQLHQNFSRASVPLLLLKGASMAQALYRDPILRSIGDIDLVVPIEHVPVCRQVLLDMGYKLAVVDHQPGIPLDHHNEETFEPPDPFFALVEIHWHILDIPYYIHHISMDWFWENTQEILIDGNPFCSFNTEANLVYLPAHMGLHHQFRRMHSLLDLALLIHQTEGQVNWQKVVKITEEFELLSVLRETLEWLANTWPDLPLSEPLTLLKEKNPSDIDFRLFRLLTSEERNHTLDFYTTLRSLPGLRDRLRYAWRNMFPQADYMIARYQIERRWQLPFWYLYRLASGLPRFARILPRAREIER